MLRSRSLLSCLCSALLLLALAQNAPAAPLPAVDGAVGDVSRLAGPDRFSTSAAISRASYAPGVPVAFVASGRVFTDALSGAPVAGKAGGPVLLTDTSTLPDVVRTELTRLRPGRIVVLGGTATVTAGVQQALAAYTTGGVERWAGPSRYATSAAISRASYSPGVPVAYLASGRGFTDALSGAPAAGKAGGPVLLTDTSTLPTAVRTELTRLRPARIVVLGGTATIGAGVVKALAAYTTGTVARLAGPDRFSTSAAISRVSYRAGVPVAYLASGRVFTDGLSGAPAAAVAGGPVLLTDTTTLPSSVRTELARLDPAEVVVLGGTASVSPGVVSAVKTLYQPASCATSSVWTSLDACGWPGPAGTGYLAGTSFARTVSGGLVITRDGTVVDRWDVRGGIQVRARNVVIRNSRVTAGFGGQSGTGVVNINPGASATVVDTTLDGTDATHACVWHEGTSMTVRRVECKRVNDGIFMWATREGADGAGDHFTIEDSWLHDFTTKAANGHVDGIQTEGAKYGVIRHNTIDVAQGQTSAIALWNGRKSVVDVLVDGNLLAGGGFAVYAEDYSPSEQSPGGGYSVRDVRFTGNVFSTARYGCVGYWGVWYPRGAPTDGWTRSGNRVLESGQSLDRGNPTYQGYVCQ